MTHSEHVNWVAKERKKLIFESFSWFLLTNLLFSLFLLIHFHYRDWFFHPAVLMVIGTTLVSGVVLFSLKISNVQLAWLVLATGVCLLTCFWCIVFYHLLTTNDTGIVFPLSLSLLFSALVPFYLSPVLFFIFTSSLLAMTTIGNVVLRDAEFVTNIVVGVLILFILYSAKAIMKRRFLYAVEREHENKTLISRLHKLASKDPLTGISNRRYFNDYFKSVYDRESKIKGEIALLLIDVDFFKKYNDLYGHLAGDECLIMIADCLESCTRRSQDLVARYGGEEFIVLLPKSGQMQAIAVAERIKDKIAQLAITHEMSEVASTVTVSQGIAIWHAGLSRKQLVGFADIALYQVKAQGRNNFACYHSITGVP